MSTIGSIRRQISGKDWDAGANILQSLNQAQVRMLNDGNILLLLLKVLKGELQLPGSRGTFPGSGELLGVLPVCSQRSHPQLLPIRPQVGTISHLTSLIPFPSQLEHVDQPVRLAIQRRLPVQQEPEPPLPQGERPPGGAAGDLPQKFDKNVGKL